MLGKPKNSTLAIVLSILLIIISLSFISYLLIPSLSVDGISNTTEDDVLSSTVCATVGMWRELDLTITDLNGNIMEGVSVKIDSLKELGVTDENGLVMFTNVPNGEYKVETSYEKSIDGFVRKYQDNSKITVDCEKFKHEVTLAINPKELVVTSAPASNINYTDTNNTWLVLAIALVLIMSLFLFAYETFKKVKRN